jgi:hypothetical protein
MFILPEALCFGPIWGFATIVLARLVLSPLFKKELKSTAQFQLVDLGSLVWLLSAAFSLATVPDRLDYWGISPDQGYRASANQTLSFFAVLLAGCLWWIAVRGANHAGVVHAGRRILLTAFAIPMAYLGSGLVFSLWVIWLDPILRQTRWGAIGYGLLAAVLYGCHVVTRRITAQADPR